MPSSIRPVRVNHINLLMVDKDAASAYFQSAYGADLLIDLSSADMHACLFEMGRVIFEIFSPRVFLLNARHGAHYLGIEYQADLDEVRAAIADHGVGIVRDIGVALHTDPADTLGVAFEFYDGHFHDNEAMFGRPMKDAAYWRETHPLGLTGLKAYRIAVLDIDAASAFLQGFLSAEPLYEIALPAVGARAIGLRVADCVVELLGATGEGEIRSHLLRHGQGIHSTLFGVWDVERARARFAETGLSLLPGIDPAGFAIPAAANMGVIFEFAPMGETG